MERPIFSKYFSALYWNELGKKSQGLIGKINRFIRVSYSSIKGFTDDECSDKASALTFYTLLSIIPILAVAFGIAKGFGFENHLEKEITHRFSDQPEVASKLIVFAHGMLQNTQSGLIAGIGLIVLFWSVVKLMSNIETSFNAIWKIKIPRSWSRRVSDYVSMMLFCPLFFGVSSSITVYVTAQLTVFSETSDMWKLVTPLVFTLFHLFPMIFAWLLFTALYYIMPNTRVPFKAALTAGIIAGTIYQITQWLYIQFQIGLASYGAIYGSFAALPLFLLWLNTSWLIALFGAEIAYHTENDSALALSYLLKTGQGAKEKIVDARILGLLVMSRIIDRFKEGKTPPNVYDIAKEIGISVSDSKLIIHELQEGGLILDTALKDGSTGNFLPSRDIKSIKIKQILEALDDCRHERYEVLDGPLVKKYEDKLHALDELLDHSSLNTPLSELSAGDH
jgi:membrane protein